MKTFLFLAQVRKKLFKYFIVFAVFGFTDSSETENQASFPNVIFILADDIGQGDIGYYHRQRTGNDPVIPTPNLDALIQSGISFSDAHTNSALCSPTRYTVITGNYTFRCYQQWGVWGACNKSGIGENQRTVAEIMKDAGYKTAFFGKWHLGGDWHIKGTDKIYRGGSTGDKTTDFTENVGGSPNHNGFDYSFMLPSGIQNNPFAYYENAKWWKLGEDSEFIINPALHGGFHERKHPRFADSNWETSDAGKLLTQKAREFIQRQTNENPKHPFFMYYCSQAVHVPHEPPAEFYGEKVKGTTLSAHGDMIKELDLQVGAIVQALKEKGKYENTLIIFSSDNGGLDIKNTETTGHDSSNGYRGSKTWIYEGGHRVPFIASWPAKIKAGIESSEPIMVHDLAATLYALTKQNMPDDQAMDSYNILPVLLQEKNAKGRNVILSQGSGSRGTLAIRKGDWKLIIQGDRNDPRVRNPRELYNLAENVYEKEDENLIDDPAQQKRVEELMALYNKIRDSKTRTTEPVKF
ncbi:MAG: sulfatase family protein [Prolixibacteraceae bacterium]